LLEVQNPQTLNSAKSLAMASALHTQLISRIQMLLITSFVV